jgi:hypothetical protein
MWNMIRWLFFLIIGLTALICAGGCSEKNAESIDYFMTIVKDSAVVEYEGVGEYGISLDDSNVVVLLAGGRIENTNKTFDLFLSVPGSSIILPGTYSTGSPNYTLVVSFTEDDPVGVFQYYHSIENIPGKEAPSYKLNLKSITDKYIEGSFTGTYLTRAGSIDSFVTITSGSFIVERYR